MRRSLEALGGVPSAARWCALVAFINALVWVVVTPPFQVPDETAHTVYVQHLAEAGDVPDKEGADPFSPEMHGLVDAVRLNEIVGRPRERATPSGYYDSAIDAVTENPPPAEGDGGAIETSNQPPLYYALAAGAYLASPWQDLLHRLWLMRIVSALLAALTTFFTFMFLREVLSQPWMWTVGALVVAFQPLFGFISSGVHADSLFIAASAGLLFALARGFRRGLTPGVGLAVGLALTVGMFTKLTFAAIIPGALLGVALMIRKPRSDRRIALRGAATTLGVLAVGAVIFVGLNVLVFDRPATGWGYEGATQVAASTENTPPPPNRAEQLSYTWQLYLPRLPFMNDQFAYYPAWQTFFKGTIGLFGWLDTPFPGWVYTVALVVTLPLAALFLLALWQRRTVVRERWPELLAYTAIAAGLLVAIGLAGVSYRKTTGFVFEQARYLLPLMPLYAAAVALATRALGRRFERQAGALIVVLAMAHGLLAQMLVISRFYG